MSDLEKEPGSPGVDKGAKWKAVADELEAGIDSLDGLLDKDVRDAVIAFNAMGLRTVQSHEGNVDSGVFAPFIDVEASDRPQYRFVGEEELVQRIKLENNILPKEESVFMAISRDKGLLQDIVDARPELREVRDLPELERRKWWDDKLKTLIESRLPTGVSYADYKKIKEKFSEANKEIEKERDRAIKMGAFGQETPEYLDWRKKNMQLEDMARRFLAEFNLGRDPSDATLVVYKNEKGSFSVSNAGRVVLGVEDHIADSDKKSLEVKTPFYNEEMQQFGKFLKNKFEAE